MKHSISFLILLGSLLAAGCKKHTENKIEPDKKFVRFIESDTIVTDVIPLDIVRTSDEGYLILGSSPQPDLLFHKLYVLKVNKEGAYEWDAYMPRQYVNPVSDFIWKDGAWHVFCMDEVTGTYLMKINEGAKTGETAASWPGIQLPLHASATPDGGFLILNANLSDNWMGLSKVAPAFGITWSEQYDYDEIFASDINRHVKRESKPLPFLTGTVSGQKPAYFFNGFFEVNFSCVFVSQQDGKQAGFNYIVGDRAYSGIQTALSLENSLFAFSRFDRSGNNLLIPQNQINLATTVVIPSTKLGGTMFAEMEANSKVLCKKMTLSGKEVIVYASGTKNKGIVLYAFDAASGVYLGSVSLQLETPCELGNFVSTSDGGLTVMAKTYIANRFARICLFKLPEEEIKKLTGS